MSKAKKEQVYKQKKYNKIKYPDLAVFRDLDISNFINRIKVEDDEYRIWKVSISNDELTGEPLLIEVAEHALKNAIDKIDNKLKLSFSIKAFASEDDNINEFIKGYVQSQSLS